MSSKLMRLDKRHNGAGKSDSLYRSCSQLLHIADGVNETI